MPHETPKNILVVDDDEEFLLYVATTLKHLGHEVICADNGTHARKLIKARRFALVLADLRLPDVSGLDVLGSARKADPLSVGIIMTGHGSMESAIEALREGVFDYLPKPCPVNQLESSVHRALAHHRLKSALIQKTAQVEDKERQLQARNSLIQNVSHELKNPLTVISGYTSFLLKQDLETADPIELRRNMESINKNADRIGELLDELNESTRLTNNKVALDRKDIRGLDLAREAVESMRLIATKKHVALVLGRSDADLIVFAESRRIMQIFSNLITNAIKFTPVGGTISVTVRKGEGYARFCVKDNGVGISPKDLPHLFERFYQVEKTRFSHKGLGLGLEICKNLIELHGGTIWADSFPEEGSSFFFTVPLTTQHSHTNGIIKNSAASVASQAGPDSSL